MAEKGVEKSKEKGRAEKAPVTVQRPTRVSPWASELERFFDEFRRLAWPRWWSRPERWMLHGEAFLQPPAIDVLDEKDQLIIKAELPGLSKDDVDVELTDTRLIIKGEKRREKEVKEEHFYRSEREYGSVYRSIELPVEVKTEDATATFKDGVLEIRLPKTEEAKRKLVKVAVQ